MAMNDFENGEVLFGAELDTLYRNAMVTQGCNLIRQLEDRSVTFSAGSMEGWAEAYVDADGRKNSVDATLTTATFDTDSYSTGALPLGAAETENKGDGSAIGTLTTTVDILIDGYFTGISMGVGTSVDHTLVIKDSGNNTLLEVIGTYDGDGDDVWTLTPSDYTRALAAGETVTLTITGTNCYYLTAQTYSGTNFSYTSTETVATRSGKSQSFMTYQPTSPDPFVIIEATDVVEYVFDRNDCKCLKIETGKWQVNCTSGTAEERRAQIYKTLFYGGQESLIVTACDTVTAIKTNISRDVGKRCHFTSVFSEDDTDDGYTIGTFAETTTNTACSSWSFVTKINAFNDETGTDTSADEQDNPVDCKLEADANSSTDRARWLMPQASSLNNVSDTSDNDCYAVAFVLCEGDITWVETNVSGSPTYTYYDFFSDGSIPLLTATTETVQYHITHDVPEGTFSSTISTSMLVPKLENWETGANVQYKFADGSIEAQTGPGVTTTSVRSDANGVRFYVNSACTLLAVRKTSNSDCTRVLLKSDAGAVLQTSYFFPDSEEKSDESNATFGRYNLSADTYYRIEFDDQGESETQTNQASTSFPYNNTYISYTDGSRNGVNTSLWWNLARMEIEIPSTIDLDWQDCGNTPKVSVFTALTKEPEKLIVRLIPESTGPTQGHPSINGIWVRAE